MSRLRRKEGIAYAMVLFLLAIIAATGLAFLYRVGARTSATASRVASMQALYLAESAADHARWRLLNEPGFPQSENVYYMHSLGEGRYGYNVKKPTTTTFAAIATVGAMGESVANQSYVPYIIPEKVMTVYNDTSTTSDPFRVGVI